MTHPQTILITGATGVVGGAVARRLLSTDVRVRALVRNPDAARLDEKIEVVRGDLGVPASLEPALQGVDAVFLVWPFLTSAGAEDVVDMITSHAHRVVYLSTSGAPTDGETTDNPIMRFHGELEATVRAADVDWVLLHPASFASNTLNWGAQVRSGVVRAPFGSRGRA